MIKIMIGNGECLTILFTTAALILAYSFITGKEKRYGVRYLLNTVTNRNGCLG